MSLFFKFLIVISNFLILSTSFWLELVLELVDGRIGTADTWFSTKVLRGGGGKANNQIWWIDNGAYLGGTLGNGGIKEFNCNFLDDTNVFSKVFTIWYTSIEPCLDIIMSILRSGWNDFLYYTKAWALLGLILVGMDFHVFSKRVLKLSIVTCRYLLI